MAATKGGHDNASEGRDADSDRFERAVRARPGGLRRLDKFDDLPPAFRGNVNTTEVPYSRRPGDVPALSDAEIDDVIAFLRTLTDADATAR
jgi:hypothetical protein